jgi:hypothetical protein
MRILSIDWLYLKMSLLQIGLNLRIIQWIMRCISSSFVVLINGSLFGFFHAYWVL